MARMRLYNPALDRLATDLSKFSAPAIPELELRDDKTLQNHFLACIFGVFGGEKAAKVRHLMTNIVRRVFASVETYRLGRRHALDYVAGDRENVEPYFLALTNFEACIGYSWQIAAITIDYSGKSFRVFTPGENSSWERLHGLYTYGTKHSGASGNVARQDAPTTMWLTNDGIACPSGAAITYQELTEIVAENNEIYYQVQEKAREKIISKRSEKADT